MSAATRARGRFISFEGGEGTGKTTQARLLHAALLARGVDVVLTREPGGTEGGEAIRDLLLSGAGDRWSSRAEALLFAAARANHVRLLIGPALAQGRWVICDRYIDSSRAYQGGAGLIADEDIMTLHRIGSRDLMPDRTVLLSMPLSVADARMRARDGTATDRIAARSDDYHNDVASTFLAIAEADPARVRLIEGTGTIDEVSGRVMAAVADLLPP